MQVMDIAINGKLKQLNSLLTGMRISSRCEVVATFSHHQKKLQLLDIQISRDATNVKVRQLVTLQQSYLQLQEPNLLSPTDAGTNLRIQEG